MQREAIIDTLENDCVEVKMKITDAFRNPYCDLTGKVFCGTKKDTFLDDIHTFVEKYEEDSPSTTQEHAKFFDELVDLCKRHEDVKSEKIEIPQVLMEMEQDPDAYTFKVKGLAISTPRDQFLYTGKKDWRPTVKKDMGIEEVPFICNVVNAKSGGFGTGACKFPDNELKRILGVVSLGTSRLSIDRWALSNINRSKLRNTGLGFIPIDKDTEERWQQKYEKSGDIEQKEYMDLVGKMGKSSGITFRYRPQEMEKIVAMTPKPHISTFY